MAGFLATYFFGFSKDLLTEFNVSQEPPSSTVAATGGHRTPTAPANTTPHNPNDPDSPAKAPAGV